ncbi:hypothetical protein [Kitasatospora sp. SUK 42]|uniref:hypothetical protein n=1 Tax=Kitasatospora sp. SUK 42 TaxID=1588882 RepID=UPI001C3153BF|nr:hypothetical protein [Kitasatospora sp. SUK 42]MBV2152720.1 hypothetical protein [Kitasatospora sp. SUK 42]
MVVALGVVPIGLGTAPEAVAASSGSAVTVPGPEVWIPDAQSYGPKGSVTVSQTKDLSNQVIQVSWSGFTPTVDSNAMPVVLTPPNGNAAYYPVRVYQCRGTDPKITDCYGSTLFNADAAAGFNQKTPAPGTTTPDFPSNMVLAPTGPDGSGAVNIEVWTANESKNLGCDPTHPCSIVVEPNYGGDSRAIWNRKGLLDCNNHDADNMIEYGTASDFVMQGANLRNSNKTNEQCAWNKHVTIPLQFAPTPAACQAGHADFEAAGLEMANRAMMQWLAGLCQGDNPLNVRYSPAGGEPQARAGFLGGGNGIALTARPDTQSPPARPYVYAPLATSGISVAFLVDDPVSGRQIRDMKLNARLLAKLLTQSYAPVGNDVIASVKGNPTCIFKDPEFQKLNPLPPSSGLAWPANCDAGFTSPTVIGGTSDFTYQLTSWIASDPDAVRFLDGEPDPWGMHVDTFYTRPAFSGYPVDAFVRQDSSGFVGATKDPLNVWKQYEWNPLILGLSRVARTMLSGTSTCSNTDPKADGTHAACRSQLAGERTLFAIMDSGQAKAYSLPEAQLLNPAGDFVSPGTSTFQAAVADMPTDPATGVQQLPYGTPDTAFSRDQHAYPLTTVQYAMVPTQGVDTGKAASIAKFLRTVTTSGQVYGIQPGQLANGFLALTSAQRQQAQDAAGHVEAQDGKLPGNQVAQPTPPSGGDNGTTGGSGNTGTETSGTGGTAGGTSPVSNEGGGSAAGGTGTGSSDGLSSSGTSGASGTSGTVGGTGETAGGAPAAPGAPAAGAKPSASATPTSGPLAAAPVAAGTPAPDRPGAARLLLPIALIGGLVLLVGGPAALFLGGTPAGARALAGARTQWSRLRRRP